ncbi:fimbrial protein [Stenotrophomonas maltophilia]|uniref:CS1 type fimbrial major subunit n=1 Tax=Stenotrophomonas maltophilia TaxID=40324 RepID=UPI0010AB3163|nr:CS1 type fimbrial major subunit [Stenotrophomonas maltophilia]TIE16161.1 fimbrial protein [Stenotrophomonas maltophilia]TIE57924.1 fimbrial protein [Stenotrophomonas maltophilia]
MNSILKKAALAAALATVSLSANAFDADIKVWANVDPTLALLKADGTALDSVVNMVHNPISGLVPWSQQVRIYSNDESKDIEVRVGSTPQLLNTDGGGAPVPLTVSLNGRALTVAAQDFSATDLFDGALPGASIPLALRIAQTVQAPIARGGSYEGIVTIAMQQKTTSP